MNKTLTNLIREKDFTDQFNNLKYRKIIKQKIYFLKRKQEDIIYENRYYKERELNTSQIINEINKELQKLNTYENKDILISIYNEIFKITTEKQKI